MTSRAAAPASPGARLGAELRAALRCPRCRAGLQPDGAELVCEGAACGRRFPSVAGVPILIDDDRSLFRSADFVARPSPFFRSGSRLRRLAERLVPEPSGNVNGRRNYARLAELLQQQAPRPRLLLVGGGRLGAGMEVLLGAPQIELVETDVYLGPRTILVCDAHDLPFADASFDGVVAQAVLEHVLDPERCVAEMHRVLKPDGLVYAETPFMQQVHGGAYDFTRWTELGHRRLFRRFEALEAGVACGPGMALAWAWLYFLTSFSAARAPRALLALLARCTSFGFKWFDPWLARKPGALDGASALYFLGRRSTRTLADAELVSRYRGLA